MNQSKHNFNLINQAWNSQVVSFWSFFPNHNQVTSYLKCFLTRQEVFFFFFKLEDNYNIMMVLPYIGHRYTCVASNLNTTSTSLPIPSLQVLTEHWLWVPLFLFFSLMLIQTESKSTNIYRAPINHPRHNLKGSIINILPLQMGKLSFR